MPKTYSADFHDYLRSDDYRSDVRAGDAADFSAWLRRTRQPDPHDAALSSYLTEATQRLNEAARAALDAYLHPHTPAPKE